MPAPPPLAQSKSDNCALACLRMVLAGQGQAVREEELEQAAHKQPGGIALEDLVLLAGRYGLYAEVAALDLEALAGKWADEVFPIVYWNRVHLDRRFPVARRLALRRCIVHAVVPVRMSPHFVWFNDPLPGRRRRISRRKFEAACHDLSNWCVVCMPLEQGVRR